MFGTGGWLTVVVVLVLFRDLHGRHVVLVEGLQNYHAEIQRQRSELVREAEAVQAQLEQCRPGGTGGEFLRAGMPLLLQSLGLRAQVTSILMGER